MDRRQFLKGGLLASLSFLLPKKRQPPNPEYKELDQSHIQSAFWWYLYSCRFAGTDSIKVEDIIRNHNRIKAYTTEYEIFWGEEFPIKLLDEVRDKFEWAFQDKASHIPDHSRERCSCGAELLTPWDENYLERDVIDGWGLKFPFAHITTTNPMLHVFCPGCGKAYMFYYSLIWRQDVGGE